MNEGFKSWLLGKFKNERPELRLEFLKILKGNNREYMRQIIQEFINLSAITYNASAAEAVTIDDKKDPDDFIEILEKEFSAELASIGHTS